MTNYEWLLQMVGEERQAWFDAEHVDANDVLTCKDDVRADGVCANDVDVSQDSREKLLADLEKQVRVWHDYDGNFMRIYDSVAYAQVKELLDRQAAITERELCKQCDWPSLAAQPDEEAYERIANLTDDLETAYAKNRVLRAHISKMQNGRNGWHIKAEKLQKQIDELTTELTTCKHEREQYRELFSKSLTLAAEIVNLQP